MMPGYVHISRRREQARPNPTEARPYPRKNTVDYSPDACAARLAAAAAEVGTWRDPRAR